MLLITGGAGFIGCNFVMDWLTRSREPLLVVDKLTYAGSRANLSAVSGRPEFRFERLDICDVRSVRALMLMHRPRAVLHFAAESHVDRSIQGPAEFVRTNVTGTLAMLEAARAYWDELAEPEKRAFRFLHVSTDEVFGSLGADAPAAREDSPYVPSSPYAASKAGADHLVRAYWHTYGLPTLSTNCSNNYGPYQFPEKLVPLTILNAIDGKPLPLYGDGRNVRDWLYVSDHCAALREVLARGRPGETYNIGARNERCNVDVVRTLCAVLDELYPKASGVYSDQIVFVKDRPGHDRRYAVDPRKIETTLGWKPAESFESGVRRTVTWFLANREWADHVRDAGYREWMDTQYGLAA